MHRVFVVNSWNEAASHSADNVSSTKRCAGLALLVADTHPARNSSKREFFAKCTLLAEKIMPAFAVLSSFPIHSRKISITPEDLP